MNSPFVLLCLIKIIQLHTKSSPKHQNQSTRIKYNQKKENTEEIRLHILNMCDKYIDGYNTDEKIRDEIDKLLDTKEWGNHYSLVLLSNHYNVNIIDDSINWSKYNIN